MKAATHVRPIDFKRRLLSAAIAASSGLATAVIAEDLHPHQQWDCQPRNGEWHCNSQNTTPGPYPQAPLAPIQSGKRAAAREPAKTATASRRSPWDWVPKQQLEDPDQCKTGCDGAYVAPPANWPDADQPPEQSPIRASADSSDLVGDVATLSGNVSISQGHRRLKTDRATMNRRSGEVTAEGNIALREPGLLVRAERASLNTDSDRGEFEQGRFLQHDSGFRGQAERIERSGENTMDLQQAEVTQCTPGDDSWLLRASEIHLDTAEGWGSAKHARLNIQNVPVVYIPYITFPIDERRKSGFLWPTLGSSNENGFELTAPYYFNIAPNLDATLAPRYIEKRGTMLESELRYLNKQGNWELSGALLDDDQYDPDRVPDPLNPVEEDEVGPPQEKRWIGSLKHNGRLAGLSTRIDYAKVSDSEFFDDLSTDSLELKRTNHLLQTAGLGFGNSHWALDLKAQRYQTIDELLSEQYQLMPQFTVERFATGANFELEWLFEAEYTDFQHDESYDDGGNFVTGQRHFAETGFSYPMQWAPGFIVPTAKLRHISYQLDAVAPGTAEDSPDATVPVATLDMGLIFERNMRFADTGYLQTLEPRLYYFYSDYEEQAGNPNFNTRELDFSYSQLFRDTRFSGHDRLEDANQVSLGVSSRFIRDEDGREILSLSLGQIFYLEDRRVQLDGLAAEDTRSNSQIAAELQYQPADRFWISNTLLWDSRQDLIDEAGVSVHYQSSDDSLYNFGYRFRREGSREVGAGSIDLSQADASVLWPVTDRWTVFARYRYDIEQHRAVDDLFGIGYEDCCWAAKLIYQRNLDNEFLDSNSEVVVERDHAIIFEFQLKGLGSLGSKARGLLEESILGYEDLE